MKMKLLSTLFLLVPVMTSALTLKEVTHKVIASNPEYIETVKVFNSVREDVRAAYGTYLPKIDLSLGVGSETVNSASTGFEESSFIRKEAGLTVTQNIFNGFADTSEISKQELRLKSSAYKVLEKANDITLKTAKAYTDVLRENALFVIAKENAKTHNKYFDEVEKKTEAGFSDVAELNQIASRLALANSALMSQRISLVNAKARFSKLYAFDFEIADFIKPDGVDSFPENIESAFNTALKTNPSIKVNHYDYLASHKAYEKQKALFYPVVNLELSAINNKDVAGVEGINDTSAIMIRLNYNLYKGGIDSANKQKSLSLMHQEKQKIDTTRRNVKEFLTESWNSYVIIDQQIDLFQKHVNLSKTTVDSYEKQFSLGRRNLLDLLIAESEHNSARQAYINGEYNLLFAQYEIKNALGDLLSVFDIKLASSLGLNTENDITISKDTQIEMK